MNLPRIIGVTGYARHGKDTLAAVLVRELGYIRVALADKMKELLLVLDPIVDQEHGNRLSMLFFDGGWEEAKKEPEVRRLLQVFGTQVGRQGLGEDVWIGALASSIPGFYKGDQRVVIPDVRFPNEAAFIHRLGGEVWRVKRPGFDNGIGVTHDSERYISGLIVDEEFVNADSVDQFKDRVLRYLRNRLAKVDVEVEHKKTVKLIGKVFQ